MHEDNSRWCHMQCALAHPQSYINRESARPCNVDKVLASNKPGHPCLLCGTSRNRMFILGVSHAKYYGLIPTC